MRRMSRLQGTVPSPGPPLAGYTCAKYYWTGSAWETEYLHANPLDSTQVVMRSDNAYLEAEVFFPFGGKRWRGGGAQDVRFAGMQERDMETELWQDPLDPTPNRMYTSGLGRWLTPDPAGKEAVQLDDPQTWNMSPMRVTIPPPWAIHQGFLQ
jgi:RHS repeat-associated protein